jgi:hypothetical protein
MPSTLWLKHWVVLGLYLLATVGFTWPLPQVFTTSVIGWSGDNVYFTWLIGWFQEALISQGQLPTVVPTLNYPHGWNLAYNEITPIMVLLGLPSSIAINPTAGYNTSIVISFVLSGMGVYFWVYTLTRSALAGFVAGALFAFLPYRMSHLYGHLNLMGTQWLPFFFLCLHRLLAGNRQRSTIVLFAFFLSAIAWSSLYYFYMTALLSVIFTIGYWFWAVDGRQAVGQKLFRIGLGVALSMAPVAVVLWPYIHLANAGNLIARSFEEVRMWSASPLDFVLPSPDHFLWGQVIASHFERRLWIESTLYVGIVTVVLAAIGWRNRSLRRVLAILLCSVGGALVLALGTDLHWAGKSVIVPVPEILQRIHPYTETFIPLPGYFLLESLPYYANMRVWMRYGLFAGLFLSVCAGVGMAYALQRIDPQGEVNRRSVAAVALILLLIFVDFYPGPLPVIEVRGRAVDIWLASQPDDGAVVQFPVGEMGRPQQTFYTLIHGKPFVGGFFAAYTPPEHQELLSTLETFPSPESIAALQQAKVQYVIVNSAAYEAYEQFEQQMFAAGLQFAVVLDRQYVYQLP